MNSQLKHDVSLSICPLLFARYTSCINPKG